MSKFTVDENGMAELINEIKAKLKLKDGDIIACTKNSQSITVKKTGDFCFVCGKSDDLYVTGNKNHICGDCLKAMQKAEAKKTD